MAVVSVVALVRVAGLGSSPLGEASEQAKELVADSKSAAAKRRPRPCVREALVVMPSSCQSEAPRARKNSVASL
jgi:hypothetical protein